MLSLRLGAWILIGAVNLLILLIVLMNLGDPFIMMMTVLLLFVVNIIIQIQVHNAGIELWE